MRLDEISRSLSRSFALHQSKVGSGLEDFLVTKLTHPSTAHHHVVTTLWLFLKQAPNLPSQTSTAQECLARDADPPRGNPTRSERAKWLRVVGIGIASRCVITHAQRAQQGFIGDTASD